MKVFKRFKIERCDLDMNVPVPWYMGLAWREYDTAVSILLPIPLNIIVSWVRSVHWRLRLGRNEATMKIFNAGVEHGRAIGRLQGHAEGVSDAQQKVQGIIKTLRERTAR